MIVVDRGNEFVMITQHDHALVSAEIVRYIPLEWFENVTRRKDVLFAVAEHDRGWIDLDQTPIWNDETGAPYSFMDFPLRPKLTCYRKGINEVEAQNPFAALLCSLHYTSFFDGNEQPQEVMQYLHQESDRQLNIQHDLKLHTAELQQDIDLYFKLLQFCDNASLYLCLNEPGVAKDEEFSWDQSGFKQSFSPLQNQLIIPKWEAMHEVSFTPFPFIQPFTIHLPMKRVQKASISQTGLAQAYKQVEEEVREITIIHSHS